MINQGSSKQWATAHLIENRPDYNPPVYSPIDIHPSQTHRKSDYPWTLYFGT
jgi:hypothetical protein